MLLRRLLAHPLTRGIDIDDPRTTELRWRILAQKRFLREIYRDWYRAIAAAIPEGGGRVLELGSGAGFLCEFVPGLIRSDIFVVPGIDVVLDAHRLAVVHGSLRAIVMIDVLHHLPRVREFFAEATRALRVGGSLVMIEPWNTPWSRLIYRKLHHEPFDPDAPAWEFPTAGPLSGANGALPWIVFERDRNIFERELPNLRIEQVRPFMPFRYLVSGGVSMRSLMPGFLYPAWRGLERMLSRYNSRLGMFAQITLTRIA